MTALRTLFTCIRPYRYELALGAAAITLTNCLDLLPPWLIKLAIDHIGRTGSPPPALFSLVSKAGMNPLAGYALMIVLVVAVQAVGRFLWRRYLLGVSRKVEYDLRHRYFAHLLQLHWGFFQHTKTGDIISRSTNDLQAIREFVGTGCVIIVDSTLFIPVCLTLMAAISPRLTVISLLPLAAASIIVMRCKGQIRRMSESVQEQLSAISSMVHENVEGIRVIQAYGQEAHEEERFKALSRGLMERKLRLTKVSEVFFPLTVFTIGVTAALILWAGGREVMGGRLTLGTYVAFNGYLALLTWPIATIGFMVSLSQRAFASVRRMEEYMAVRPEVCDDAGLVDLSSEDMVGEKTFSGEIEFRSLTFAYDGMKPALTDINLRIRAGTSLAIAGPVGSGKSTLVKLIPRIYCNAPESLFVDGIPTERIPLRLLRELIGYVDQEPFLFSGTIRENIAFGAAGLLSERQIEEAVSLAGLDREIGLFPLGLDTVIGERGVTLSGGQKQRVALARAIAKGPKILILDDAFSHLDALTEAAVFANIRKTCVKTTVIMISHRVSAMREADAVAIMNDGRIIDAGTHGELASKTGAYNSLYREQLLSEKEIIGE